MDQIYQNLLIMMEHRGYDTSAFTQNKSNIINESDFDITFISPNLYCPTVKVFFSKEKKIGINNIKDYISQLESLNITNCIIIYSTIITSFANQYVYDMKSIKFTFFHEEQLKKNLFSHYLVPFHKRLTPEEKQNILKNLNIHESIVPKIRKSDAMCKYLGVTEGDLVQITRTDNNVNSTYYRICI
jgi:DNA-directed RNA polymerase I, II, and III subunit RPABC1